MSNVPATPRQGRVVTFYSYKGGTGRSMALANMAWLLAASDKKVLVIDWDLEAPGIHRYFKPFLIDEELDSSEGLIDLLWEFVEAAVSPESDATRQEKWYEKYTDCTPYIVAVNTASLLKGGKIDLMPAGKQGSAYPARINLFDWGRFYSKLGGGRFLEALRNRVRAEYDYVLIDSRTGVSDTSGICTAQMPDTLVVCFTYNNQSIKGASKVAETAVAARAQLDPKLVSESRSPSAGVSPTIYPVPTRVDQTEQDKLEARRRYARAVFDPLLVHIPPTTRNAYWVDVEIPQIPYFAYEEIVAPFRERAGDPKSALAAAERLLKWIAGDISPNPARLTLAFEQDGIRRAYAATPYDVVATTPVSAPESLPQKAERHFNGLGLDGQLGVRSLVLNLIGLRLDGTREIPYRLQRPLDSLPEPTRGSVDALRDLGVIREIADSAGHTPVIELAGDVLLKDWPRIQEIFANNAVFLRWHEGFRSQQDVWARSLEGQRDNTLLTGPALEESEGWLRRQPDDLSESEREFIRTSSRAAQAALAQATRTERRGQVRVFLLRPFGVQEGIDFDKVESDLIQPALKRLREFHVDVADGTTGEISAAGNFREDTFGLLVTAQLVVADVTIHNANAFYELGIRHALCPRFTMMIREKNTKVKHPFDLQTDRYFNYDYGNLAASVGALATTMQSTLARTGERDSPIFTLRPTLEPHERGKLVKVPESFLEDVTLARRTGSRGDLRLFAYECAAFAWDQEGLQVVGDAQFKLRAYAGARDTFELLRKVNPNHYHANWRLGTIYQRLASASQDLMKAKFDALSDDAISRALGAASAPAEAAEQHSLKGSNAKNRWTAEYRAAPPEKRAERALESPNLEIMLGHYMRAAACDLNAHYPAINALAFLRVQTLLARANPQVWDSMHDSGADELKKREHLVTRVSTTLRLTLRLDPEFEKYQTAADDWAASSIADFTLLSTPDKTAQISRRYREASAQDDWFTIEAKKRNLLIFKELGLLEPGVTAALAAIDEVMATKSPPGAPPKRVVLFSGPMVDRPGRPPQQARFPATPKAEGTARQLIKDALVREVGGDAGNTLGIAGGACGGDILFHEVCAELGIRTDLYLLLPQDKFQVESVDHGGADWVHRYQKLCASKKDSIRQLQDDKPLPNWLIDRKDYSIWERNNLWMMFNALVVGADNATLLALLNAEREADGPDGTKHLIELAKEHGFKPLMIDAKALLG